MEIEGLKVVHALPGRVRLKVAKIKGNPVLARKAQARLAKVKGIRQVEANPMTGSLLLLYDLADLFLVESLKTLSETLAALFPEIEAAMLAAWLTSLVENPGIETGSAPAVGPALTGYLRPINTEFWKLSGGLDLKLLLPLTLVFLGLRALWVAEKVTFPVWYDYLWFGFGTYVLMNRVWRQTEASGWAAETPLSR
jgi:hypothetical protein